jgi:hypothetical protein
VLAAPTEVPDENVAIEVHRHRSHPQRGNTRLLGGLALRGGAHGPVDRF